jgi:hypothetical protein
MRKFQAIQLVELWKKKVSAAWRSRDRPSAFRCSTTMPPWLCTMPLGKPVVPEENSTHRGVENSTCSNTGSSGRATSPA